jgi:hypothetical protein
MGELFIYRPPSGRLGAAPVAVASAIPLAGFETDPLLPAGGLVQGGATNGWIFSFTDDYNYSGFQKNNSIASTNINGTRFYAPAGVQTAVMMGTGIMETQISVPQDGDYKLQFQLNACTYDTSERGGYDFRVMLDGNEIEVVTVEQLKFTQKNVLLRNLTVGSHALRFEGINSVNIRMGSLIDDLKLLRYELPASQVITQGADFTLIADSAVPLVLSYKGSIQVGDLWVDGVHLASGKYSADVNPAVFAGPGFIGFNRGTIIIVK